MGTDISSVWVVTGANRGMGFAYVSEVLQAKHVEHSECTCQVASTQAGALHAGFVTAWHIRSCCRQACR